MQARAVWGVFSYFRPVEGRHIKDNYMFVVSGLKNVLKTYDYFDGQ